MGPVTELNRLCHHVHATNYDGGAEVQGRTQYSELLRDLKREFSGRKLVSLIRRLAKGEIGTG